uniref:Uncharacterized protein n=1 Tax=Anguilla anguilla TaxID=7936 RepID=A0A0E9VVC4_ANGAN
MVANSRWCQLTQHIYMFLMRVFCHCCKAANLSEQ